MNIDQLTAKLIEGLLPEEPISVQEVGEGSTRVFPYIKEHDDVDLEDGYLFGTTVYSFTDTAGHYYNVILEYDGLEVTISFTADESFEQTNSNELYSVISTVFKIAKEDLSKTPKNLVNLIKYTPASTKSKPGQNQKGSEQRDRVYQAYLKKLFPGSTIEKEGSDTLVYLQETYKGKRTSNGAPGTFKAKITKAYGGPVTIEKAEKFKNRENATPLDKRQANWFINFHSKNEDLNEVGEANLKPYKWQEIDREGYYVYTRFITDSETQYDLDLETMTYTPIDSTSGVKALGIEFTAKPKGAEGSSAKIVVNKGEMYRVMSTITDIIKKYIKKFKAEAIIYSPSKKQGEDFGTQRDQLYKAFISKTFPEVKFEQKGDMVVAILPNNAALTLDEGKQVGPLYHYTSADGLKGILNSNRIKASEENYMGNELYYISFTRNKNFHNKGSKFGVKTDYRITLDGDKLSNRYKITPFAYKPGWNYQDNWEYDWLDDEPESVVRDFFNNTGDYDEQEERISFKGPEGGIDNIKNYILSVDKVDDLQENIEPAETSGEAAPYGSGYKPVEEELTPYIVELTKYMYNKGLAIDPAPEIEFIEDESNAKNIFGRTAYYDPTNKVIVLYITGRHPKDILRSFAHEMIHHKQNLEGKLTNPPKTTNINEDDYLKELEREAYEEGNMFFRGWENSRKQHGEK